MKVLNWESVEESTPFSKLPAGGYVIRITDVEDVADKEYLNVVYDIKEGDFSGFYSDDFGRLNPWAHRFVRSYKDSAAGMFKQFLARLEDSNKDFSIAAWQTKSDERELVGLELGVVLQNELYTNNQGEDKERLNLVGVYAAQDIRNGDFKLPEPKDRRVQVAGGAGGVSGTADPYDDDVPF